MAAFGNGNGAVGGTATGKNLMFICLIFTGGDVNINGGNSANISWSYSASSLIPSMGGNSYFGIGGQAGIFITGLQGGVGAGGGGGSSSPISGGSACSGGINLFLINLF